MQASAKKESEVQAATAVLAGVSNKSIPAKDNSSNVTLDSHALKKTTDIAPAASQIVIRRKGSLKDKSPEGQIINMVIFPDQPKTKSPSSSLDACEQLKQRVQKRLHQLLAYTSEQNKFMQLFHRAAGGASVNLEGKSSRVRMT